MSDIVDGIARIIHEFRAANLKPPSVILLDSHDEGIRFLSAVRQIGFWQVEVGSPLLGKPVEMSDGSVWMEVRVMDIAIRWPANRIATKDGSWSYL